MIATTQSMQPGFCLTFTKLTTLHTLPAAVLTNIPWQVRTQYYIQYAQQA